MVSKSQLFMLREQRGLDIMMDNFKLSSNNHPDLSSESNNLVGNYVIPLLSVFRLSLLFPHKIIYDKEKGCCVKIKGSIPRRVISGFVDIIVLLILVRGAVFTSAISASSALGALYLITYAIFAGFSINVFHFGWTKMDQVVQLLNDINSLAEYMGSFGAPIKCKTKEKVFIYGSITVSIVFTFLYATVSMSGNTLWNSIRFAFAEGGGGWTNLGEILYQNVTMRSASTAVSTFTMIYGEMHPSLDFSRPVVIILGISEQIAEVLNSCFWVFTFCALFLWATLFGRLFEIFLYKVKTCSYLGNTILQDIHDFNRLTIILDKFNEIYGNLTFCGTIAGIINGSVTAGEVVLNNEWTVGGKFISLGALIPLIFLLLAGSRVNHLANEYGSVLKQQYTSQRGSLWDKKEMNFQVSYGLAVVFHEIQKNSVGIQGGGYFTISYSFIGTAVSALATYAVLMLQWGAVDGKKN